jgi:N-acetylmuramoyl-L-alanine amidase
MAIKQEPKVTKKKTIIIDPGHGGRDPGAISNGIMEKTIALKVAKKLKSSLQKAGYNVLLTRTTDTFVPLQDRPKFAAQAGGDLFISLHCNAIDGSATKLEQIQGYVAYILRAGKSEEDITLARRENKAIILSNQKKKKAEISPVEWILLEHELNLYSHQSEKLAENIVNSFKSCKIIKHRTGAHQAGFFVLVGTFMPAVLFEMGFITNQKDRSYMVTNKGQKDISSRLFNAIQSFFQQQK